MSERIYIVAGNYNQAEDWAYSLGLSPNKWVYVSHAERLKGISHGLQFVRVGTWFSHRDIEQINDELIIREAIEVSTMPTARKGK